MSQDFVKYGFALLDSKDGKVVGIDSLSRETSLSHKFFCPHCHGEMYPTFGPIKVSHFRHNEEKCKPDKYLHDLAEKIFEEEYLNCLENGIPFILEIHSPVNCFEECLNKQKEICSKYENKQTIDLTKAFTKIEKESHVNLDGHFRIPDILLSTEGGVKDIHLWVEIWVKHETEEKKRAEGNILEIKVASENNLKPIKEHRIVVAEKNNQARIFNADFPEECILKEYIHDTIMCTDQIRNAPAPKKVFIMRKQHALQFDKPIDLSKTEWVDLGLPSGVLWAKDDEDAVISIHKALQDYPDNLPSESDAEELMEFCSRHFDSAKKEMVFTGPNGNTVSFKCTDKSTSYWLNGYESYIDIDYGKCFHLFPDNSFYINNKDSKTPIHIHLVCRRKN